jgi:hypothetical protein
MTMSTMTVGFDPSHMLIVPAAGLGLLLALSLLAPTPRTRQD